MSRLVILAAALGLVLPGTALAAPELNVPADATGEASSPTGGAVTFTVSAYNVPGGKEGRERKPASFSCNWAGNAGDPLSGTGAQSFTRTFPLGQTSVVCTTGSVEEPLIKSFDVRVRDTTPPSLHGVPGARTLEATGPSGATVTYVAPTATDLVDGAVAVVCTPASGSTFSIGVTEVGCASVDSRGNRRTGGFAVTVRDTTPPTLVVPAPLTLAASSASGVPATDAGIAAFLGGAWAVDAVDPAPAVRADAPLLFPVGTTSVRFTAVDRFGNSVSHNVAVLVSPFVAPPAPPPPPPPASPPPPPPASPPPAPPPPTVPRTDTTPPAAVSGFAARVQGASVTVTWTLPADADLAGVELTRAPKGGRATTVYSGMATRFVDRGVAAGRAYTYVIRASDESGNRSDGVTRTVTIGPARGLLAPSAGVRLTKPPVLRWTSVAGASYYNVQLWRNGKKILSAWPAAPRLALRTRWTFSGKAHRLSRGTYRWYVWPGVGSRGSAKYGKLIGTRTFVMR